ncbi:MAG TPA: anthranilate phosphoribosyltransferase [Planctomycetaceae bacterium]|nr:anthranilate phosphoribosyltransferase [Planctomycetaceae bacterium]
MSISPTVHDVFTEALVKIVRRKNLTEAESYVLFQQTISETTPETLVAGLLAGLAVKGETFEELAGAAKALRAQAAKIHVADSPVVDLCGTGGGTYHTFNISTTASFVVAGAGCVVAKHGNVTIGGQCGSADVLAACGFNLDAEPKVVEECIAAVGIGFMCAPKFHTAFQRTYALRRRLGIRTIFNMLGPLVNPAGADCMIVGVFAGELTEMFARALRTLGVTSAMVVYGHDGMDEITVTAPTRITELRNDEIRTYNLRPEVYFPGEKKAEPEDLRGGGPQENATLLRGILDGSIGGPARNIVLLNAAAAIVAAGKAADWREGVAMARHSIKSGFALEKLESMIAFSRR